LRCEIPLESSNVGALLPPTVDCGENAVPCRAVPCSSLLAVAVLLLLVLRSADHRSSVGVSHFSTAVPVPAPKIGSY
jgi:hypothetical protein